MMIYKANKTQLNDIIDLVHLLWNHHSIDELKKEIMNILENKNTQIFIMYQDNIPIAFAQCQLRYDYVEGTTSSPIAYLEGILVRVEYRKQGYAKMLIEQCEMWAREKGCTEFASDCELNNVDSFQFHISSGFREVNRIICFTKKL